MTEKEQPVVNETSGGENVPTTSTTPIENIPFEMDKDSIEVHIKVPASKGTYVHVLRKPTFDEEEARERKMPLITSEAGKFDGEDASKMSIDDEPANVYLYDKTIQSIRGYAIMQGGKAHDGDINPDMEIDTADGKQTVRSLIPAGHKNTAINGMFPSRFEVEVDEDEFTFALGGGREWRIRQEVGGRIKQEDGQLSPPDYTIVYTFREPTEKERKTFRTSAIIALNLRDPKTNTIRERRSTNLRVIKDLFNALIVGIEGATIGGNDIQVSNKEQLAKVPSDFKKGTMIKLFSFLEADLGN